MKKIISKISCLVAILTIGTVAVQAQEIKIYQGGSEVDRHSCMNINSTGMTFSVPQLPSSGSSTTSQIVQWTWSVSGGISIESGGTSNTVTIIPASGTDYSSKYSKYAKGKLHVTCRVKNEYEYSYRDYDRCNTPPLYDSIVTNPYTYYTTESKEIEIGKEFSSLAENAIVGPNCIKPGSEVTFSVAPWVSMYSINSVGTDSYEWTIPSGLKGGDLYFSADSSSITFQAGTDISNKIIEVKMGSCNIDTQTPITLTTKQDIPDPIFANGFKDRYYLPLNTSTHTITITNLDPNATYVWDLRSWEVVSQSANGSTITFRPTNDLQTHNIRLDILGGCSDRHLNFDILRQYVFDFEMYPNPATNYNPVITIKFDVNHPRASSNIHIYDSMGNVAGVILSPRVLTMGSHEYTFNTANLPAGIYYVHVKVGGENASKQLTIQ